LCRFIHVGDVRVTGYQSMIKVAGQVDKDVAGNINGGGPEVVFKTFDGEVYIRKAGK
jgi:hypothetical protein